MKDAIFPFAGWKRSRRTALFGLLGPVLLAAGSQDTQLPDDRRVKPPELNEDPRLPDGKSQKNAIAKEQHEQALKEANELVETAEQLRDQLRQAGNYIVPVASVKKTEEIEKLARRIRGRLKY